MTSPLYQSLEDIFRKISLYRQSLAEYGHDPQQGKVALMIHTFLGKSVDEVKQKVKEPFTNYLKTHFELMAKTAGKSRFSVDPKTMTPQDLEDLLTYSFETYFNNKVLMGTPESCQVKINDFRQAGVDEVAALIDFGVKFDWVMESLNYLQRLKSHYELVPAKKALVN